MKSAWIAFRHGVFRGSDAITERKGKPEVGERKMMWVFAGYCECISINCLKNI
jgi:hypothetical protein